MKKTNVKTSALIQGSTAISDMGGLLFLMSLVTVMLCGCADGNAMRTTLAVPPPPFNPAAFNTSQNEYSEIQTIEPAAGDVMPVAPMSYNMALGGEDCGLRLGGKETLSYQWGESRVGLGMGSRNEESDLGVVTALRYSISLHENAPLQSPACTGRLLWD